MTKEQDINESYPNVVDYIVDRQQRVEEFESSIENDAERTFLEIVGSESGDFLEEPYDPSEQFSRKSYNKVSEFFFEFGNGSQVIEIISKGSHLEFKVVTALNPENVPFRNGHIYEYRRTDNRNVNLEEGQLYYLSNVFVYIGFCDILWNKQLVEDWDTGLPEKEARMYANRLGNLHDALIEMDNIANGLYRVDTEFPDGFKRILL
jgi:hypothetical protein